MSFFFFEPLSLGGLLSARLKGRFVQLPFFCLASVSLVMFVSLLFCLQLLFCVLSDRSAFHDCLPLSQSPIVYLSACLLCLSRLFVCVSSCPPVCWICLPYLFVCPPSCLPYLLHLPYLFDCLSFLPASLSVCLSACLHVCPSLRSLDRGGEQERH